MVCNCLVERNGETLFSSYRRGIAPLISLIESLQNVNGATAYDKIVGKAAALLYVYMGVRKLCAHVMSKPAQAVLEEHGIEYSYEILTERIINRAGDGVCPMEAAVESIEDPLKAIAILKTKLKILSETAI